MEDSDFADVEFNEKLSSDRNLIRRYGDKWDSKIYTLKSSKSGIFQVFSSCLALFALVCFLVSKKETVAQKTSENLDTNTTKLDFQSWIDSNQVKENTTFRLLDLENFKFTFNNASKCNNHPEQQLLIILIISAPKNLQERTAIRKTWGSLLSYKEYSIRIIFLTGIAENEEEMEKVKKESWAYGDIVTGNFIDSYKHLSYKHMMGYKWILEYCNTANFVVKADDDAFIDLFQLLNFIERNIGPSEKLGKLLMCNVQPEGTKPVREQSAKWSISKEEYPYKTFPKYCSGLSYIATLDVIKQFLQISQRVKKNFWIDDIFITGIIRELAQVEPFYLNLRYSYDPQVYKDWLQQQMSLIQPENNASQRVKRTRNKLPFIFIHLPRGNSLLQDEVNLWRQVSLTR